MKRRAFIAATCGLLAWNFPAHAQPPASVARVGLLVQGSAEYWVPYLKAQKAGLLYVIGDALFMGQRPLIAELALRNRLPSMFLFREHVEDGGLMSYGIDIGEHIRQAAGYVDKILRGALPRDLPIEEPTKYELVINLKTAKALGLKIPQTILLRADRGIE